MSRPVSAAARAALNAQQTAEAFITLLTIDHADLASPIRVCNDAVDTVSNGNTFVAFPFQLTLPTDADGVPVRAQLVIDNVDQQIVTAVRSIATAPTVLIQLVLASTPDTIEMAWPDFLLKDVSYDALIVSGQLTFERYEVEPYPARRMTPTNFPGMF